MAATAWQIRGSYFESCNCDPICPCRRVGGTGGGRSTHGVCAGVLSWLIDAGEADGTELDGLAVAMAIRYDDDEPGSPWTVRPVAIEVDHTSRRQWLRIRDRVSVRIRDRFPGAEAVTCVIPGHDRDGEELVADELRAEDGPLALELHGTCDYGATFAYSG